MSSSAGVLTYQANWRSDIPGTFLLRVTEPLLESIGLSATTQVRDPADELARAAADHDRLARLAEGTGGAVVGLNELGRLETLVADLSREVTQESRRPLTQTMAAFLVLLALATVEWVLRRLIKLA